MKSKKRLTFATNTPIIAVASSGPEEPAAIKVAPATSGGRLRTANQDLNTLQCKEALRKPPGNPQEAPRKPPGNPQETPRKPPGNPQETPIIF